MDEKAVWVVQQIETLPPEASELDAIDILTMLAKQEGFVGGRVYRIALAFIGPEPFPAHWQVQAFFEDCGVEHSFDLPYGMRRVLLLPSLKSVLLTKSDLVARED